MADCDDPDSFDCTTHLIVAIHSDPDTWSSCLPQARELWSTSVEQDWLDCRVATVEAEEAMKTMAAAMTRRRQQDRAGVGGGRRVKR